MTTPPPGYRVTPEPEPRRLDPPYNHWAVQVSPHGYASIISAADIGQRMRRVWATLDPYDPADTAALHRAVAEAETLRSRESR